MKENPTKKEVFYDNKNAKTECPECNNLNTFYEGSLIVCKDCKTKIRIAPHKKNNPIALYLGLTFLVLIFLYLVL